MGTFSLVSFRRSSELESLSELDSLPEEETSFALSRGWSIGGGGLVVSSSDLSEDEESGGGFLRGKAIGLTLRRRLQVRGSCW